MLELLIILGIGYLTGVCGFLPGIIFGKTAGKLSRRFQGSLMGFTGGLLIAFICFEMLPKAFETCGLYLGIFGILAGVCVCAYLENKISSLTKVLRFNCKSEYLKSAILLAIGVSLHNIPEGMAIGSISQISPMAGIRLAVIIAIHCIPEGIAVSLPFIKAGLKADKMIILALLMGFPLAFGALAGGVLGTISPIFITLCLSFAGGVMLYITCGEVIPNSKGIWRGRLSTILGMIGFIAGILLTSKI